MILPFDKNHLSIEFLKMVLAPVDSIGKDHKDRILGEQTHSLFIIIEPNKRDRVAPILIEGPHVDSNRAGVI